MLTIQSMGLGPAAAAPPRKVLEMQNPDAPPRFQGHPLIHFKVGKALS